MSPQRLYGDRDPKPDLQRLRIPPSSATAIGIMLPLAFIWKGYLLTWVWLWFAVPIGLPEISIPQAIGLNCLTMMIVPSSAPHKDYEWRKGDGFYTKAEYVESPAFAFFGAVVVGPLPTFVISWIVSLWM